MKALPLLLLIAPLLLLTSCSRKPTSTFKRKVVFTDYEEKRKIEWKLPPSIIKERYEFISLMDLDTGEKKPFSELNCRGPILSPNGKKVAFFSDEGSPFLVIHSLDTNEEFHYEIENARTINIAWLNDNKSVVFSTYNEIIILNTTDLSEKKYNISEAEDISVSPDSRYIVYWSNPEPFEILFGQGIDRLLLCRLDLSSGKTISYGVPGDLQAAHGLALWAPDSQKFLIRETYISRHTEEIVSYQYRWFSKDLEPLDYPTNNPIVIQQDHHPYAAEFDINR